MKINVITSGVHTKASTTIAQSPTFTGYVNSNLPEYSPVQNNQTNITGTCFILLEDSCQLTNKNVINP